MPEKVATRKSANVVPVLTPLGSHTGKPSLPLGRPFTLIGSRHRAHLHLLSRTVSKSHAAIIAAGTGLYIRDLASRERVYVNDKKVREADLATGDIVRIGSFVFKYNDPGARQRPKAGPQALAASLTIEGNDLPIPIEQRTLVIGRRPTCDLPLVELSASTIHAIIFEVDGQRYIRDLGSRTGTMVNGAPVHQRRLINNDAIKIGETTMRYVVDALAKAVEEAPLEVPPEESLEQADVVAAPSSATPSRAPESAPIPVAGEDGLISIAPEEPAPAPASKLDLSANDDTGQHLLVASDLHEERLSGSGSFADVHAHVEDEDGLVEHQPVNLDWWPENNATPAVPAAEQQTPARHAVPQPKADDELIPLAFDEDHVEGRAVEAMPVTPQSVIPIAEAAEAGAPESASPITAAPDTRVKAAEEPLVPREPVEPEVFPEAPEPSATEKEIVSSEADVVQADLDSSEVAEVKAPLAPEMSSEVADAAQAIELLPETEPTPESAQALEPDVSDASEPALGIDSSLVVEDRTPNDLSDSSFGRVVEDLAGPPLGPLVEEAAAHAPADELVSAPEIPQTIEPSIELPESEEDLDVVGEAPIVVSDRDAIELAPAPNFAPVEDAAPVASAPQLSDDAAADLLTADPELPPIPNLAELLGEDEPTGDDIVDNANAFLAHAAEESSEPVNDAPMIEAASPGSDAASVDEADLESHAFTVPADLLAEAGRPKEELSEAAPVDTTITLDVPRSEEIAPTDDRIDVEEYEPTESADELDIATIDVAPARAEVPEAESEAPEVTGPSLAPQADELVSSLELELRPIEREIPHISARPSDDAPDEQVASAVEPELNLPEELDELRPVERELPRVAERPVDDVQDEQIVPELEDELSDELDELRPVEREVPHISARPQIDDHDEHTAVESGPETLQEVDEPLPIAPHVLDEAPSGEPEPLVAPAAPVAEMREDPRSPAPASSPAVPAGSGSLNDLLSIMSRDAGSFMGGMPLSIAPIATPGVVPVTLKLKEDPPAAAAPPTPAPIGKVEPNLPASKVVGVPPKDEVDDESSFFEDKLDALDDLPDELEPIGDITEAVGEAPVAPPPKPAPAPPRQSAPPPPPVRPQAPPKIKLPPPPPRQSRRSAPQPIEDEEIVTSMPPGAGGHSSAFDGLAIDDEEASVDAFSLLPPPDANDPVFGNEQQQPSARHTASPGPSVPQRAARPAVPQRPAPARQPDAPQLPDGPAPQPPRKRRKWKFFGVFLMALSLGGFGLAMQKWPYRVRAVGHLSFDGLDQLAPEQRRQVIGQSAKLDPGDVAIRTGAIALCSAQNIKPGFLENAVAVDAIARSARFDGITLHLEHVGRDESDRVRMGALLSSLYEANRFLQDRAQSNQRRQEEINHQLQENRSATDSLAFRQKLSEDRARAAHSAQLAGEKLAAREQALRTAAQKVAELEQTAKGPAAPTGPAPASADSDSQLLDLVHQFKLVEARIALARDSGGDADKVNEALATAITAQLKQIVDAQSSRPPDSPIAGYLSAITSATSAIHDAAAEFISQQKSGMDSLAELHRDQAKKSQARLQALFSGDSQLVGLQQKWAIKDRQANTAADANLVAQATRFRGEADALHKQIDQRRTELVTGIAPDTDQNLADSLTAKIREQQEAFAQRLAEQSKRISQSAPNRELLAPADKYLASRVDQQAILVEAAAQQLAASLDAQPDPAMALRKLEVAIDDRRKQLDEQAEVAVIAKQKQIAGVGVANALLVGAQDAVAKATEQRDTAKAQAMDADQELAKLPPVVIDQAEDNLRASQLDEESKQLKSELARLNTYPLIAPRDPARSVDSVQIESVDPLPRIAASFSILVVGALLCGLMFWLNGLSSRASADTMELAHQHQLAM